MVLGADREPLDARVQGRPLGDRPGRQRAVHLQPEVVVKRARGVLLDRETRVAPPRIPLCPIAARAGWLGGQAEVALPLVLGKSLPALFRRSATYEALPGCCPVSITSSAGDWWISSSFRVISTVISP